MKIILVSNNRDIFDGILRMSTQNAVVNCETTVDYRSNYSSSADLILIDSTLFEEEYPWTWLTETKENFPTATVYVRLSESDRAVYRDIIIELCSQFDYKIIPMDYTGEYLLNYIKTVEFNVPAPAQSTKDGKVFTFISAASKDGATTMAINAAYMLSEYSELSILLVDWNLLSPSIRDNLNIIDKNKNIINLLPSLSSASMPNEEFKSVCVKARGRNNLSVITGVNRLDIFEEVTTEQVKAFLDKAKSLFDVVIMDVHTFVNNAATFVAVTQADERYVVATPIVSSYMISWRDWYNTFWKYTKLEKSDFKLIINRFNSMKEEKPSLIEAESGLELLVTVANVSGGEGIKAITNGFALVESLDKDSEFYKDIYKLSTIMASKVSEELSELGEQKQKSFFQKIFSR